MMATRDVVKLVFERAKALRMSKAEVERKAGLAKGLLSKWGDGAEPRWGNLMAACEVVGIRVEVSE